MSTSFSIGAQTFSGVNNTSSRQALAIYVGSAVYDNSRIHVKGTDGNFFIRGGKSGGKVVAIVRYVAGSEDATKALFDADCAAWGNAAVQIVRSGLTLPRCNLDPHGGREIKTPKPSGDGAGNCWFDAQFDFTQDA